MFDFPEGAHSSPFADMVFGGNPFPKEDALHELWQTNAQYAAEEIARHKAQLLCRLPKESAKQEEFLDWILETLAGLFDILARRVMIFTVKESKSVPIYEELLAALANAMVTMARSKRPRSLPESLFATEARIRLNQRKAHHTAAALKLARTESTPREGRAEHTPDSVPETADQPIAAETLSIENSAVDRRASVDAYISEVFKKTGKRITRTDIWKAARYKSRTEFERWERDDLKRGNKSAHPRFTRILTEKPHLK